MLGNEDGYSLAVAVVPSDTVNFTNGKCHALYIGGTGDVVVAIPGSLVTFAGVPAGTTLRVRAIRINATNTTATNIVALY